jgi:REP element-mobilizing transposase RayT
MPRQVRIEFPGAFYHVMARGNHLDPIFLSPKGQDQELFLKTLGDACEQTGFRIWAWVLMNNHYHLVLETPKANLVAGMGWLQNTYTRRLNARHKLWGRLFGDRYKSILIEDSRSGGGGGSSYLTTLIDYVHLNPARAGLIAPEKNKADSTLDYPWSSIARGFALSPKKRPKWLAVEAGINLFGFKDTARNRRRFVERLDGRMTAEATESCGLAQIDGQTLNSSLRRGWYWGSEGFRDTMLRKLDEISSARQKKGESLPSSRDYSAGQQAKDHHLQQAEAIIARAARHFGVPFDDDGNFPKMPRGDLSAVATAWSLCRHTTMPQRWIGQRLALGSKGNVSERVRRFARLPVNDLPENVRKWKELEF